MKKQKWRSKVHGYWDLPTKIIVNEIRTDSKWSQLRARTQILGSYPQKPQLESLCKLSAMQFAPCHRAVVFAKEFIYSPSKGDMALEKGLRSQHGKYV